MGKGAREWTDNGPVSEWKDDALDRQQIHSKDDQWHKARRAQPHPPYNPVTVMETPPASASLKKKQPASSDRARVGLNERAGRVLGGKREATPRVSGGGPSSKLRARSASPHVARHVYHALDPLHEERSPPREVQWRASPQKPISADRPTRGPRSSPEQTSASESEWAERVRRLEEKVSARDELARDLGRSNEALLGAAREETKRREKAESTTRAAERRSAELERRNLELSKAAITT